MSAVDEWVPGPVPGTRMRPPGWTPPDPEPVTELPSVDWETDPDAVQLFEDFCRELYS